MLNRRRRIPVEKIDCYHICVVKNIKGSTEYPLSNKYHLYIPDYKAYKKEISEIYQDFRNCWRSSYEVRMTYGKWQCNGLFLQKFKDIFMFKDDIEVLKEKAICAYRQSMLTA